MLQVALPRCERHDLRAFKEWRHISECCMTLPLPISLQGVGEASKYCTSLAAGFRAVPAIVLDGDGARFE